MNTENEIYQILKKHMLPLKKREELIIDLLDFVNKREEQLLIQRVVKSFYCDCDTPKPLKRDMYDKTHCNFCRKEIEQ